mgnify:CR=1 FL=1
MAQRSPTSTATPSSTSPAASAASTSATRIRSVVAAAQEQLATLRPHRLHDRPLRALRRRSPSGCSQRVADSAARQGGVLQRRHGSGRERGQVRARLHGPPGGDRVRGRLPRPHAAVAHADLEDASVQGRAWARSRPRSTGCRSRTSTAGPSAEDALAALERALITQVAAETVAAIVIEPVQGEGGFVVAPQAFLARRPPASATEHGIVLVVDEVQTGFGRTGALFAIEHYGVEPDLITVAKSIAAGLPLSGVLGKAEIMDAPGDSARRRHLRRQPGRAGGCARRSRRDRRRGGLSTAPLSDRRDDPAPDGIAWQERWPQVGDVRGLGAMLAIELVTEPASKEPDVETLASAVVEAGRRARAAAAQVRHLFELHPSTGAARPLGRRARRSLAVWEDALEATLALPGLRRPPPPPDAAPGTRERPRVSVPGVFGDTLALAKALARVGCAAVAFWSSRLAAGAVSGREYVLWTGSKVYVTADGHSWRQVTPPAQSGRAPSGRSTLWRSVGRVRAG